MERGRPSLWLQDLKRLAKAWSQRTIAFARVWWDAVRREYRGLSPERVWAGVRREVFENRRLKAAVYVLVVTTWVLAVVWSRLLVPLDMPPFFRPAGGLHVIGFFENESGGFFGDSLPSLKENPSLFDTISPFWYSVGPDGTVSEKGYRDEVVDFARSRGIRIVPLVTNLKEGPGNGMAVVTEPDLRAQVVTRLADLTVDRGFDGLDMGFQLLPQEARDGYSTFINELAEALRARGKRLTVSVFSDIDLPAAVSGFIDYSAIGRSADLVVLQAFDRHWTLTPPGPIAPLPWVEASLERLTRLVPASKIVLNIGAHAYDWPEDRAEGIPEYLPTEAALRRAALTNSEVEYYESARQSFYTYRGTTGIGRVVWVQDARHLVDKVQLARRHRLAGVALWRLGFTEPGAIEQFEAALSGRR